MTANYYSLSSQKSVNRSRALQYPYAQASSFTGSRLSSFVHSVLWFVVSAGAALALLFSLYRNDVLLNVARNRGMEQSYRSLERRLLGGPGWGTPAIERPLPKVDLSAASAPADARVPAASAAPPLQTSSVARAVETDAEGGSSAPLAPLPSTQGAGSVQERRLSDSTMATAETTPKETSRPMQADVQPAVAQAIRAPSVAVKRVEPKPPAAAAPEAPKTATRVASAVSSPSSETKAFASQPAPTKPKAVDAQPLRNDTPLNAAIRAAVVGKTARP